MPHETSDFISRDDLLDQSKSESPACSTDVMGIQTTFVSVDQEVLRTAHDALDYSLEHVKGELVVHDATLGRGTLKNKTWALRLESDIRLIDQAIVMVRKSLGWPVP